jgi:dTDP-4-dehydrorhamnose reductase
MLILGAGGFIGSEFRRLPAEGEIYTARNSTQPGLVSFDPLSGHISSIPGIDEISHVLILYAEREPDRCSADPAGTARINVDSPKRIIRQCVDLGLTPIFASSELVFDGEGEMYSEADLPSPILEYGRQKLATERYLLETCTDGIILRFPKTVGSTRGDRSLFTTWLDQIHDGVNELNCAEDQWFSIQDLSFVPLIVRSLVKLNVGGVFHLGDGARHSRLNLLKTLLDHLTRAGYSTPSIRAMSIDDFDLPERRPKDVSLDNSLLSRTTGLRAPSVSDVLGSLLRQGLIDG